MNIPIIVKILVSLAVILVSNKILKNLLAAIVLGAIALALWIGHSAETIIFISITRLLSLDNIFLISIVMLVIWLSNQMEQSGIMRDLVLSLRTRFSPRASMAMLPAVIGMLPMPGGALFSAPLVDDCDTEKEVPATIKTQINYWFRHIWELTWPLFPSVLLAAELSGLEVWQVFLAGIPLMISSIVVGYFFILRKVTLVNTKAAEDKKPLLVLLTPVITVITIYAGIMFILPVIPSISRYLPMLIGVIGAITVLQTQRPLSWLTWRNILGSKRPLVMASIVAAVRIYGAFIDTQLPGGIMMMEQMRLELVEFGIPLLPLLMLIPFISGLTTGISIGFVGTGFPIAFSLLGADPALTEQLGTLVLTYTSGFVGLMLSPVHLCFIVTNEHFKTSLIKNMGYLVAPSSVLLLISYVLWYFLM